MVKLFATPSTTPALFGGGLLGYVMYDVTHYYLHHGQPSKDSIKHLKVRAADILALLFFRSSPIRNYSAYITCCLLHFFSQKYHLNHHFRIQNKGFGITSSIWDRVFGTLPQTKAAEKSR